MTKKNIAVIFGGTSSEYEISLISAQNIIKGLDKLSVYNLLLIHIDKLGKWYFIDSVEDISQKEVLNKQKEPIHLVPGSGKIMDEVIHAAFPIVHGPSGEDGSLQGFLKLLKIPFIGPDILSSAVCMDKEVTKCMLLQAGLPTAKYISFKRNEKVNWSFTKVEKKIGAPFYIKPARMGSSIGVCKVTCEKTYLEGLREAFLYDDKVIVEEEIKGREVELSLLGNENPKVSCAGEITCDKGFYSYKAKYLSPSDAKLSIPARIEEPTLRKLQRIALEVHENLKIEGMSRVDCFLTSENEIFVNEVNTIPGFTEISMYPKLWEESGLNLKDLLEELIRLSRDRFSNEQKRKTTFEK
tara:strand:+ start:2406 stop:3467 length:1062 start_codon:yes stop_codon:yes gene_type:complete